MGLPVSSTAGYLFGSHRAVHFCFVPSRPVSVGSSFPGQKGQVVLSVGAVAMGACGRCARLGEMITYSSKR